jgi:hypothetical protein
MFLSGKLDNYRQRLTRECEICRFSHSCPFLCGSSNTDRHTQNVIFHNFHRTDVSMPSIADTAFNSQCAYFLRCISELQQFMQKPAQLLAVTHCTSFLTVTVRSIASWLCARHYVPVQASHMHGLIICLEYRTLVSHL